ncbi:MAG: hypothetical protein HW396_1597, partial [Candidatus Dadabacteria bacterium]|nr:hypothetical protein [Candidatus Dadabacteria bacterium]
MLTPIMIAVGAFILLLGAIKTSFQERVF